MFPMLPVLLCLFLLFPLTAFSASAEIASTLDDQNAVAVTIYNQDLALVRDSRTLNLPPGQQTLAFREVKCPIVLKNPVKCEWHP